MSMLGIRARIFGQGHLTLGQGTVAEAFIDSGVHGGDHLRVAVAQIIGPQPM